MARMTSTLPKQRTFGQTTRTDNWWLVPLLVFLGLGAFVVYSTWAAFQGANYASGPYLSPMYSPLLFDASGASTTGHSWFGSWPSILPGWPLTPALLILWAPGIFRFTCYYYRGSYYKAFWQDPTTCAVGEPRKSYWGERKFPLIMQNVHRYFMYLALLYLIILAYDAFNGFWFAPTGMSYAAAEASGKLQFGMGLGTIVLIIDWVLLTGYTLGCHSLRHWIGGRKACTTKALMGQKTYNCVSCLNRGHMVWAWLSLFWVAFTDIFIRLCATGIWHDVRIF